MIDSSLWVDFFRSSTPRVVKEQVLECLGWPGAFICEPVRFELLRGAGARERGRVAAMLSTFPLLETPHDLWGMATELGAKCFDTGKRPRPMDLLISAVCLYHKVELATFDAHFSEIASISPLRLHLLRRAA